MQTSRKRTIGKLKTILLKKEQFFLLLMRKDGQGQCWHKPWSSHAAGLWFIFSKEEARCQRLSIASFPPPSCGKAQGLLL